MFIKPSKFWLLKWALYGLKDTYHVYFIHIKNKLEEFGIHQFIITDPYLFILLTVICSIYYVNNYHLLYKTPDEIDILTKRMKKIGMLFEEESAIPGYIDVLLD